MAAPAATRRRGRRKTEDHIPVLPVRDTVHYPSLINTLLVGREPSLRALHAALDGGKRVLELTQRDVSVEEPKASDLYTIGVISEVVQVLPMPDGTMRVVLRGESRFRVESIALSKGFICAAGSAILEQQASGPRVDATMREAMRLFDQVTQLGKQVPFEALQMAAHLEQPGALADVIAHHLPIRPQQKQEILQTIDPVERLGLVLALLSRERDVLNLQADIRSRVEEELGQTQREYYLREQLKIIQQELNERDDRGDEVAEYSEKIDRALMPPEVREKAEHELKRLERAPTASPESMVIRTYLDWLTSLPWSVLSEDSLDVRRAKRILDRDHFGLDKVKDRILDFLAVRQLSGSLRGPILCFVGPPGVGKTSIGKSIAEALGRKFIRISLGGVRDEAEIRGHRRTYIGSMPGRIIQGIKNCGTRNPVFMLDEIDKMTMDFRGDPTSALLEALDPEQNDKFGDHYIESPFDLSAVMFICTANLLENIPWPLRDRMEIIQFPSYTEEEKIAIAEQFLIGKKLEEHGLKRAQISIPTAALRMIVREYTREAGVRNLEREIATLCRKSARRLAEGVDGKVSISTRAMPEFLGPPRYTWGEKEQRNEIGAATGLVYTEFGGDVVSIEVNLMPTQNSEAQLILTGQLGDVMKESAQAAITCIRSKMPNTNGKSDVHIHVPAGAVPKDGPSAGITMAVAFASALTGRPVRADVAMTGEITLRGKVLPIGGLREKILAAHRAGIKNIIIPAENKRDLVEVPQEALSELQVHFARKIDDVLSVALA